ncbi:HORMA domain [Nesidiocoris tenuis]|uniref:HORMA domain n=1 Tax=Nesidiocoris tenuis TaxID=355587 RepID=A0ABN7AQT5_9HEMI|nr:HORMA domain [Nesidiocoris tenuis]
MEQPKDLEKGVSSGQRREEKVQQEPHSLGSSQPMSKSLKFTKRLSAVIFSVITFERGVFPKNAYTDKHFSQFKLPVLSGKPDCSDAYGVTTNLRNALSALDKGYLKDLILDFVRADESILESFSISYDYDKINSSALNSSGFSSSQFDKQAIIYSIEELLLSLRQNLKQTKPSSNACGLRFRTTYHHERTPESFLPKGFYDMNQELEEVLIDNKPIGNVVLPFHSLCLGICNGSLPDTKNSGEAMSVDNGNSGIVEMSVDIRVNCVCGMNEETSNVFRCRHCGDWHHFVCYRRKPTSFVDPGERRVCYNCAQQDGKLLCLDATLAASVSSKNVQNLVIYRQVVIELSRCKKIDVNSFPIISRLSEKYRGHFIDKLIRKKILKFTDKIGVYNVESETLKKFVDSYFM